MLLSELLCGVEVLSQYKDVDVCDIRRSTRGNMEGCVYICIKGAKTDGHLFAKSAEEKGAAAVIAQEDTGAENQILVPDTAKAYAAVCENFYGNPAKAMKLIAVTGTNGKTSVATIIKRLLCHTGVNAGLISTIQAEYAGKITALARTTPDAYDLQKLLFEMRQEGIDTVVMEASSHALVQERLWGIHFDTAVFTNLTQDHLDYHKTMEAYFRAKEKLFRMADFAVVNTDDSYGRRIVAGLTIPFYSYSTAPGADFFAEEISCGQEGVRFTLCHGDVKSRVSFGIPGLYSVHNALAAIAVCNHLGVALSTIIAGLPEVGVIRGRNELIETGRGFSVICDYAHTPDGLENILKSTREYARGRVVVLFGCGGDRDREKRPLMGAVAAKYADYLIITSDNPRTEGPNAIIADILKGIPRQAKFIVIPERRDAIRYAVTTARKGDTVILAGKGHEEYQTLGDKNLYFDERRLVEGILRTLKK